MSNLYWLNEGQMSRLRPFFPRATDVHALMTGVSRMELCSFFAMGYDGMMPLGNMRLVKRALIVGTFGVERGYLLKNWKACFPSGRSDRPL